MKKGIFIVLLPLILINSCISPKSIYDTDNLESSLTKAKRNYNKKANALGLTFSLGTAAAGAYLGKDVNFFYKLDNDGSRIPNSTYNSVLGGVVGFGIGSLITYYLTPKSSSLYKKATNNFNNGNYAKSEKLYLKTYFYSANDVEFIHKSYSGLARVNEKNRIFSLSKIFMQKAYDLDNSNKEYIYDMARYSSISNYPKVAYDWLYKLDYNYARNKGKSAFEDPLFHNIQNDFAFYNWCNGYRRLKFKIENSVVSSRDWLSGPDQFVTLTDMDNYGKRRLLLATNEKSDTYNATWDGFGDFNTVVFDHKLGFPLELHQHDADVMYHEPLTQNEIYLPNRLLNDESFNISTTKGSISVSLADTDSETYTQNVKLPPTYFWEVVAAAALYGIYQFIRPTLNTSNNNYSNHASTITTPSSNTFNNTNNSSATSLNYKYTSETDMECITSTSNKINLYSLIIGTDEKVNSDNDAEQLAKKILDGCGNKELFKSIYCTKLKMEQATKDRIMSELQKITRSSQESDIVMIYFSGHGGIDSTNINQPFIFGDYFNNPIYLNDIIFTLNADNAKTILWFDACHAGKVSQDFMNNVDNYLQNQSLPNVSILMSSSDNQPSFPNKISKLGFFTETIIDGLNGSADGYGKKDQIKNNIISLDELIEFVIQVLPQRTNGSQIPQKLKSGREEFNTRLSIVK